MGMGRGSGLLLSSNYRKIETLRQNFVRARSTAGPVEFHIGRADAVIDGEDVAGAAASANVNVEVAGRYLAAVEVPESADCTTLAGRVDRKDYVHVATNRKGAGRLHWLQRGLIYPISHLRAWYILLSRIGCAAHGRRRVGIWGDSRICGLLGDVSRIRRVY